MVIAGRWDCSLVHVLDIEVTIRSLTFGRHDLRIWSRRR